VSGGAGEYMCHWWLGRYADTLEHDRRGDDVCSERPWRLWVLHLLF